MKSTKKQESINLTLGRKGKKLKAINRSCLSEQMSDLTVNDFKVDIINMSTN